jgi:hypothetical protein
MLDLQVVVTLMRGTTNALPRSESNLWMSGKGHSLCHTGAQVSTPSFLGLRNTAIFSGESVRVEIRYLIRVIQRDLFLNLVKLQLVFIYLESSSLSWPIIIAYKPTMN